MPVDEIQAKFLFLGSFDVTFFIEKGIAVILSICLKLTN